MKKIGIRWDIKLRKLRKKNFQKHWGIYEKYKTNQLKTFTTNISIKNLFMGAN
jgi:hypothetical protein